MLINKHKLYKSLLTSISLAAFYTTAFADNANTELKIDFSVLNNLRIKIKEEKTRKAIELKEKIALRHKKFPTFPNHKTEEAEEKIVIKEIKERKIPIILEDNKPYIKEESLTKQEVEEPVQIEEEISFAERKPKHLPLLIEKEAKLEEEKNKIEHNKRVKHKEKKSRKKYPLPVAPLKPSEKLDAKIKIPNKIEKQESVVTHEKFITPIIKEPQPTSPQPYVEEKAPVTLNKTPAPIELKTEPKEKTLIPEHLTLEKTPEIKKEEIIKEEPKPVEKTLIEDKTLQKGENKKEITEIKEQAPGTEVKKEVAEIIEEPKKPEAQPEPSKIEEVKITPTIVNKENIITFSQAETGLTKQQTSQIDKILQKIYQNPKARIRVVGYASENDKELNHKGSARRISLQRVIEIRKYLIKNNVDHALITVQAMGEDKTNQGLPLDRVEINVESSN
ncbi:MAG: OmpA family protein [Sphingobacteriia bacterium]|nr:OmpA family protein [Sphingobacteriia bacterium]